jgi:Na+/phosphate symporter
VLLALPLLHPIARELAALQPDAAKMAAEFHLFNVALAALSIGTLDGFAWLLARTLPEKKQGDDASQPRYLDETALKNVPLALANAAREPSPPWKSTSRAPSICANARGSLIMAPSATSKARTGQASV